MRTDCGPVITRDLRGGYNSGSLVSDWQPRDSVLGTRSSALPMEVLSSDRTPFDRAATTKDGR